mmetsp:Transcript_35919/g.48217  ORF Transcript_35919/g.48217 Transcript_35919/m.48217 type:complete len:91 (+) Transcript_35919:80-352(+)
MVKVGSEDGNANGTKEDGEKFINHRDPRGATLDEAEGSPVCAGVGELLGELLGDALGESLVLKIGDALSVSLSNALGDSQVTISLLMVAN